MHVSVRRVAAGLLLLACSLPVAGAGRDDADPVGEAQVVLASSPREPARWLEARDRVQRALLAATGGAEPAPDPRVVELRVALGDLWWHPSAPGRNWGIAWSHYGAALDRLGSAPASEWGRRAYLGLLRRFVEVTAATVSGQPPTAAPPLPVLAEAVRLASDPEERGHLMLGIALRRRDAAVSPQGRIAATAAFEAAIQAAADTPWEGPARLAFARWCLVAGRAEPGPEGSLAFAPDPARASRLLEPWGRENPPADPPGWPPGALARSVGRLLDDLRAPVLDVRAPAPDARDDAPAVQVAARNLSRVVVTFSPVDLAVGDLAPTPLPWWAGDTSARPLPEGRTPREVVVELPAEPLHELWRRDVPWPGDLGEGAFLVSASGDGAPATAPGLVVISGLRFDLVAAGNSLVAWLRTHGQGGAPVADATVELRDAEGRVRVLRTDKDGLARQPAAELATGPVQALARHGRQVAVARIEAPRPAPRDVAWHALSPTLGVRREGGELAWTLAAPAGAPSGVVRWALRGDDGTTLATGFHEPAGEDGAWTGLARLPGPLASRVVTLHVDGAAEPLLGWVVLPQAPGPGRLLVDLRETPGADGLGALELRVSGRWLAGPGGSPATPVVLSLARDERAPGGAPRRERVLTPGDAPLPPDAQLVWTGAARTGADGRFAATLALPRFLEPTPLVLQAIVHAGPSGSLVAERRFVALPSSYAAELLVRAPSVPAGGTVAFSVRTRAPTGQPVAVTGRLTAELRSWTERWRRPDGTLVEGPPPEAERRPWWSFGGGSRLDPQWQPAEPVVRLATLAVTEVVTDRDGVASGEIAVPSPGELVLRWASADVGGLPVVDEERVWVGPTRDGDLPILAEPLLLALPDAPADLPGSGRWMLLGDAPRGSWLAGWSLPGRQPEWAVVRTELGSAGFSLAAPVPGATVHLRSHDGRVAVDRPGRGWGGPRELVASPGAPLRRGEPGTVRLRLLPGVGRGTLLWALHGARPAAALVSDARAVGRERWDPAQPLVLEIVPEEPLFRVEALWIGDDGTAAETAVDVEVEPEPEWTITAPRSLREGDTALVQVRHGPHDLAGHAGELVLTARAGDGSLQVSPAGPTSADGDGIRRDFLLQHVPSGQAGGPGEPTRLALDARFAPEGAWDDPAPAAVLEILALPEGGWARTPAPLDDWEGGRRALYAPALASRAVLEVARPRSSREVVVEAGRRLHANTAMDPVTLVAQVVGIAGLGGWPADAPPARQPAEAARLLLAARTTEGGWPAWRRGPADWDVTAAVALALAVAPGLGRERGLEAPTPFLEGRLANADLPAGHRAWLLAILAAVAETNGDDALAARLAAAYVDVVADPAFAGGADRRALAFAAAVLGFVEDVPSLLGSTPWQVPDPDPSDLAPDAPPHHSPDVALLLSWAALDRGGKAARSPGRPGERDLDWTLRAWAAAATGSRATPTADLLSLALHGREGGVARGPDGQPRAWPELELRVGDARPVAKGPASPIPEEPWTRRSFPWPEAGRPLVVEVLGTDAPGAPPHLQLEILHRGIGTEAEPDPSGLAVGRRLVREHRVRTLLGTERAARAELPPGAIARVGDQLECAYRIDVPAGVTTVVLVETHGDALVPGAAPAAALELRAGTASGDDAERLTGRAAPVGLDPLPPGDDPVLLFARRWVIEDLSPGSWELVTRWRLAHPGRHALPPARVTLPNQPFRHAQTAAALIEVAP